MKLGNNLRKYRFEYGEISQQALANAIGVTRLTIHSIEKGKFIPSTYLALRLALFFGTKVEDLFFIPEDYTSDPGIPPTESGR
ncbi:helix-turn-helix transcriptional regulator [Acidobacteriota bacterium]